MKKEIEQYDSKVNLLGVNGAKEEKWVKYYSNERNISAETPPAFLLHCTDDDVVNVKHSLLYFENLLKHNIPAELLLFERGGHGPNAFLSNPAWKQSLQKWLDYRLVT
jgi:dipeptidyl aminopeptidase/acylaminoacyl peptidase